MNANLQHILLSCGTNRFLIEFIRCQVAEEAKTDIIAMWHRHTDMW